MTVPKWKSHANIAPLVKTIVLARHDGHFFYVDCHLNSNTSYSHDKLAVALSDGAQKRLNPQLRSEKVTSAIHNSVETFRRRFNNLKGNSVTAFAWDCLFYFSNLMQLK